MAVAYNIKKKIEKAGETSTTNMTFFGGIETKQHM